MGIRKLVPDPKNPAEQVWAETMEIAKATERFSVVELEDGTIIEFKPVVTEVFCVEGRMNELGDKEYSISSQVVANITTPRQRENG